MTKTSLKSFKFVHASDNKKRATVYYATPTEYNGQDLYAITWKDKGEQKCNLYDLPTVHRKLSEYQWLVK